MQTIKATGYNYGMGKTHQQQQVLKRKLGKAKTKIAIGATYQHYKSIDKTYKVIGLGFLEASDQLCVIYQALYGESLTFIRPLSVWLEHVTWEGKSVPRFIKIL